METKPWHRLRGGTMWLEKRTNAWAALIGFYIGRGRLAPQIADILHDGTTPETIRRLVEAWGLPKGTRRHAAIPVQLPAAARVKLQQQARQERCSPEELARRVLMAAIENDRFDLVLNGPALVETAITPSDHESFWSAVERLSMTQQMKLMQDPASAVIFVRSDGRVRWEKRQNAPVASG